MFTLITGIFCLSEEWNDIKHYENAPSEKLFCSKNNMLLNTPLKYKEEEEMNKTIDFFHKQDLIMVIDDKLRKNVIIKGSIPLIKDVLPVLAQSLDNIDIYTIIDNDFVSMTN